MLKTGNSMRPKKERRKALVKGSALGCFWSALVIIGMFVVLGILSYLLVRFVIPEDFFSDTTVTSITESISESARTTG